MNEPSLMTRLTLWCLLHQLSTAVAVQPLQVTAPEPSSVLHTYQSTDPHTTPAVVMVVLFVCAHSIHSVVCAVPFLAGGAEGAWG